MKKIKKTQWHPAFCSAIRLELREDKELADSVLQVAMIGNREVFEETKKEGDYMCEALRELFSDEIEAEKARARREGRRSEERR